MVGRPTARSRSAARGQARARWGAACAAAVVLAATAAHASGAADISLDYQSDAALPSCPDGPAFRRDVARQLGYDPFRDGAPHRIVVRFLSHGPTIEGRVEWRDANDQKRGEREFSARSQSCAHLARAVAFATAIQIQLLASGDAGRTASPSADSKTPAGPSDDARATTPSGASGSSPSAPPASASAPPTVAPAPPPRPSAAEPGEPSGPPASDEARALGAAPREPRIAVDVGVSVMQDLGDGPTMVVPRIAVSLGRPARLGLRLSASGLGPGAEITRPEGVARIDRFLVTLEVVRSFRPGRLVQPSFGIGAGLQDVHARGISAMPTLTHGHEGHVICGVAAADAGLAFVLAVRLALFVDVEALLYRPSVTVQVGSAQAARLDGAAVVAYGGLLARF